MLGAFICCFHFKCMNICVWVFPLCCSYFFSCAITKWVFLFFLHIVFWHLTSCWHICIAQLFVCFTVFFLLLFALNMQFLVCLIFCDRFVDCFIAFLFTIVHICIFCFLQVLAGVTSSFMMAFCAWCLLFSAFQSYNINFSC